MARFLALHQAGTLIRLSKSNYRPELSRGGAFFGSFFRGQPGTASGPACPNLPGHCQSGTLLCNRRLFNNGMPFSLSWGAAVGGAIQLMKTSTGRILSITSMLCVSSQKINLSWRTPAAIGMSWQMTRTIPAQLAENAASNGGSVWLTSPETGLTVTWADAQDRVQALVG